MEPEAQRDPSPAVGRLSAEFVLAFLKRVSRISGGDFLDGVIRLAILDANIRHLIASPEVAKAYASFETPIPDEMRRPASINAVAGSLGLPFETVRRRVHALDRQGLAQAGKDGVILSQNQLITGPVQQVLDENFASLAAFYGRLRTMAPALELVPAPAAGEQTAAKPADEPVRVAMRSTVGYVLRYLESAQPVAGDFLNAIMFLAIVVANVGHITNDQTASDRFSTPQTVAPDSERRRLTVHALSKDLGMSFETTRRRVNALMERGVCLRDGSGIYVPAATLLSDPVVKHRRTNAASLQRLFGGLQRLGVRFD
ncbi:hypothetical protein [Phenylobacterium sp.]|uniref:hypothetical protein n=1 Tax=Phenylobacterium sp. TaxID=1871053 RepID=UPI0035B03346